jgi:hypothetical protein
MIFESTSTLAKQCQQESEEVYFRIHFAYLCKKKKILAWNLRIWNLFLPFLIYNVNCYQSSKGNYLWMIFLIYNVNFHRSLERKVCFKCFAVLYLSFGMGAFKHHWSIFLIRIIEIHIYYTSQNSLIALYNSATSHFFQYVFVNGTWPLQTCLTDGQHLHHEYPLDSSSISALSISRHFNSIKEAHVRAVFWLY